MKRTYLAFIFTLLVIAASSQNIIIRNPGCSSYDQNGICKACSTRYYRDKNNICQPVNSNCKTYDEVSGDCLSCYAGWGLIQGTCLPGLVTQSVMDPNCNRFDGNVCAKCSFGYYFNTNGVCTKADPNCQTFNDLNGDCTSCYSGFALSSGRCNRQAVKSIDLNCNKFNQAGQCIKCSSGYYFKQGTCTKIDDSCKDFDLNINQCKSCYSGYSLNAFYQCTKDQIKVNPNPYCSSWNGDVCSACAKGSIFNQSGICVLLDANCKSSDLTTGQCTGCYSGYTLSAYTCIKSGVQSVSDPNCNQFDQNGICIKCSSSYYFNDAKVCTKIDDNCKSFSIANEKCMDCYPGYQLNSLGQCFKVVQQVSDVNCAQWNGKICNKCSVGSAFNSRGVCTLLDPQCKSYNSVSKICISCYAGFQLNNLNVCVKSAIQTVSDPLCAEWNNANVCTKCSKGSFFNSVGKCTQIDPSCSKSNQSTGECLACYDGYQLNSLKTCVKAVQEITDVNCAQWDGKVCVKCSVGATFDNNKKCIILDAQCKEYDQTTKICKICYAGYELNSNKVCVLSAVKQVKDPLCAQWNGQICTRCAQRTYFSAAGVCTSIDSGCKTANQVTGICLTCYNGYQLSKSGTCVKSIDQLSDLNCAQWKGKVCQKCSFGAAFNNVGKCIILDAQCKQYDSLTGLCKSCYVGYVLNNLQVCSKAAVQDVTDSLCSQWKQDVCVKCSPGSYLSASGKCTQIDPNCKAANTLNGACLGCYDGYQLSNLGTCVKVVEQVSDVNCAQWNGKTCKKCSVGATFNNFGRCILLDSQCKEYDSQSGHCKTCYAGYALDSSFSCIKSIAQNVQDPLCASWQNNICTKCSTGSFLNSKNVCSQVDPSCRSFNQLTGDCLSCYPGYQLSSLKNCVKIIEGANPNPLCAEFTDGVCLRCSSGSFFNGLGVCQVIDPLCKTSNALSGACTSCFSGYAVSGSKCVVAVQSSRDPLCQQFNGLICVRCSFGAFFNAKGACQLSDPLCSKFDQITGACTACYPGHVLVQNKCQVDKTYSVNDPFCAQFNNQICVRCSDGYYFQKDGKCTAVDPLCATFNKISGQCLSCFTGFQIKGGLCVVAVQKAKDPNCASFNGAICNQCSKGYIFDKNNLCVATNPLCRTVDTATGICTGCYTGYVISGNTCIVDVNANSNCAEYVDSICIRCASRSYMNSKGDCQKVSEDCRTYNDYNGNCLSCYSGFTIKNGQCLKDQVQGGCSELDVNGQCTKCAVGFYVLNGKCNQIDAQCAKFNTGLKQCEGCYSGYTLLQGRCEISKVNQQFQVKNCIAYNSDNKCIQCFDRFYLSNNQCKQVNVFCKTYDLISGLCTGCYSTFKLTNGQCKQ